MSDDAGDPHDEDLTATDVVVRHYNALLNHHIILWHRDREKMRAAHARVVADLRVKHYADAVHAANEHQRLECEIDDLKAVKLQLEAQLEAKKTTAPPRPPRSRKRKPGATR